MISKNLLQVINQLMEQFFALIPDTATHKCVKTGRHRDVACNELTSAHLRFDVTCDCD